MNRRRARFFAGAVLLCLPSSSIANPSASVAPASVQTVEQPPVFPVPREVVAQVLSTEARGSFLRVNIGGEQARIEVEPAAAEIFPPGSLVRGFLRLPQNPGQPAKLENLWPASPEVFQALEGGLNSLETALADPQNRLGTGSPFPFHALMDERARVVTPTRFQGRHLLVNFVYGRCADPTMCSSTAQRMAQLHSALPERIRSMVEMVFITLDPDFDTPARCLQYLRNVGIDRPGFCMLTGPNAATEGLYKLCGLRMERFGETGIQHAQVTFWIGPTGRLKGSFPGKEVSVESMMEALVAGCSEPR